MLKDIKAKLLEAGKEEGCISFSLLNNLLPEDIKEPNAIEELFDFLGDNNIEIVSEEKPGQKKTLSGENWEEYKLTAAEDDLAQKDLSEGGIAPEEAHDPEETTTTYLREMGRFELLTPVEEGIYSRTIREGFDAIIKAIRGDESGVPEAKALQDRIDLWEKRDPSLKPKKQQLNFMKNGIGKCVRKYPNIRSL